MVVIYIRLRSLHLLILIVWLSLNNPFAIAQNPLRENAFQGQAVPREVREIYERGLQWLENNQDSSGRWKDQNASTGYLGSSMYHHGFAMLALAEAYGAVDERKLWEGVSRKEGKHRSIGEALELAVRTAITSQNKNSLGAWRYSPDATDADTSVSGSVMVGLLAARNAGIEVPDKAIDRAIDYFITMTSPSGQVAYAGGLGGFDSSPARVSIATLVYSIAGRKDLKEFKATSSYLKSLDSNETSDHYGEYTAYYRAQALFQSDIAAWEKWNKNLIRELKEKQRGDGHFEGNYGAPVATSMSLLALALNFRFLPIYER